MTAQAAVLPVSTGIAITALSGAAAATDTYPPCVLVARNTGAGTHVVTIACNFQPDGLVTPARTVSIAAGTDALIRVPALYADANGRVSVSVDGTASEVKLYPIGA